MHTCGRHRDELIPVEGGFSVCPACEAEAIRNYLEEGRTPPMGDPDWVVPAQAAHAPRPQLKPMTIRLDNRDLERAKVLAREIGLPYQRYIRELLTRALDGEERRVHGPRVGGDPSNEGPPGVSITPISKGTGMVILLVEDDHHTIELMRVRLEAMACKLLIARNADEGLQMARTERPQLILLDLKLDGGVQEGMRLLESLKADPKTATIPVYIHSVFVGDRADMPDVHGRAEGYLPKPLKSDQLRVLIAAHRPTGGPPTRKAR